MTTSELETALNCYQEALKKLEKSQSPQVKEVLGILNARDTVQTAWSEYNQVSTTHQELLVELDSLLKSKAGQITKVMDLAKYRNSFQPAAAAWWWRLETEAPPHLWDRWDWLWRGLTVGSWTVNLSLLIDIVPRFLSAGTGFAGVAVVAFPSILTLLQARSELTQAGKEGFEKLLNKLGIPKHYHEEAKFGSTLLLFAVLVLISLNKPTFSDWYNRQGVNKHHNQGQLAGAEADYLQALALDPDNAKAHYNLGSLYEDLQEFDKAKSQYQFAVKENLIKAENNLARLWILENKPELATPLLWKSLQQAENEPLRVRYNLMKNLGWAWLQQQQLERAETILTGAIALGTTPEGLEQITTLGSAHCLLAQVYQQQKRNAETLEQWQKCCQLGSIVNPDEPKWLSLAHKALKEAGKPSCNGKNGKS
ncbi:tetratricopeptide repeat protein [Moorena producens JHB]|uniref:Tetratricopeptide repeat protein n=1 Tax=Moorena producens (strain JHB) TaxID=1454205 RepID=A0A1D9G9U5_MOOP1|nr:tetratricopeptide repeat protein [Moorena producens]AOY84426.1 tetratricopeptide repeat protein [Moorena producens JHB]